MPYSYLIFWCPLLLLPSIFPSIRDFSSESAVRVRWPKYGSLNFSNSPFNNYSEFISLKIDWVGLLAVQGTLRRLLSTIVQRHQFLGPPPSLLSSSHNCPWPLGRPQPWLYIWTFVGRVLFLLFNTLSRFVIVFLPRSKRLLFYPKMIFNRLSFWYFSKWLHWWKIIHFCYLA